MRDWFIIAVLIAATLLTVLGKLPGPDWVKLVLVLAGLVAHSAALAAPAPEAA
ncbi:MAG TPA: hypothetical protein VIV09_03035 [Pseudolabrys sp.]